MIEEKYMKQLKKLEDELFPRLSLAKLNASDLNDVQLGNSAMLLNAKVLKQLLRSISLYLNTKKNAEGI